jgi:hypothetical protein
MKSKPYEGQLIRLRYGKKYINNVLIELQNSVGVVETTGLGPGPRNVAIRLWNNKVVVVPRGNIYPWDRKFRDDCNGPSCS